MNELQVKQGNHDSLSSGNWIGSPRSQRSRPGVHFSCRLWESTLRLFESRRPRSKAARYLHRVNRLLDTWLNGGLTGFVVCFAAGKYRRLDRKAKEFALK